MFSTPGSVWGGGSCCVTAPTGVNLFEFLRQSASESALREESAFLWKAPRSWWQFYAAPSTSRKHIITGCIMCCSIMSESIVAAQDCWIHYYSMCSNCKTMIILYDPSNDRWGCGGVSFSQLVFSTYLSVMLLNTSRSFKGGGTQKFGSSWKKIDSLEFFRRDFSPVFFFSHFKPNCTLTFRSVAALI